MSKDLIAVLDLGSTKAACIAAIDSSKGMEVLSAASVPCNGLRRGSIADLDHTANCIDMAVRKVQQDLDADIETLVVGIGGAHLESMTTQGLVPLYPTNREITRDDVLQVMNHSRQISIPLDREQIQALPREFRVDGVPTVGAPIGKKGNKLEVTTCILTGTTSYVQNLEEALKAIGKKIEMVVVQPLASGLGVLVPQEIDAGCAVVDIGGGTTDVAIFHAGSIEHIASLPIGGQLVTADLSKLLKTSLDEAERLKAESSTCAAGLVSPEETAEVLQLGQTHTRPMQRRVLCEIVESRMKELGLAVRQQIEESGMTGKLAAGVILTGGGSRMAGIEKLFEAIFPQTRIRLGAPRVGGKFSSLVDIPEMATGVGLARFALECADDELATAASAGNWKERIRTFWSLLGAKA